MRLWHMVLGWWLSVVEFFRESAWAIRHPLKFLAKLVELVVGTLSVLTSPRSVVMFLAESPYEPYKAMTVLAVYGAILAAIAYVQHDAILFDVSGITMAASGYAYLIQRSLDFSKGGHIHADGIDGLILLGELMPFIGGLAVVTRAFRMEAVAARTEEIAVRTITKSPITGRLVGDIDRTIAKEGGSIKAVKAMEHETADEMGNLGQQAINIMEWGKQWGKASNDLFERTSKAIKSLKPRLR